MENTVPIWSIAHIKYATSYCQHFKRYHAELRGATLFLYKDERQDTVSEL